MVSTAFCEQKVAKKLQKLSAMGAGSANACSPANRSFFARVKTQ
jgi:hypothetical protein